MFNGTKQFAEKCKLKPPWDIISHLSERLSPINQQTTSADKDVEKEEPFALLVGMQTGAATVESNKEIPQKIKNGSAFWPRNPTSGNIFEGTQNTNLKEHMHPYAHFSIIYNCQDMEVAQVSISTWPDKTTMGCLHNGILLSHKKENLTLCNSIDGPGEHHAKWNKPVRERQIPYDFIHVWNLMNKLN